MLKILSRAHCLWNLQSSIIIDTTTPRVCLYTTLWNINVRKKHVLYVGELSYWKMNLPYLQQELTAINGLFIVKLFINRAVE